LQWLANLQHRSRIGNEDYQLSETLKPSRCFQFQKSRQLFTRSHNEAFSVTAMCVSNPDRSPFAIHR
jgi:hypothetical protein